MDRCNNINCKKRASINGNCKFHSCRCSYQVSRYSFTYGCLIHDRNKNLDNKVKM